MNDSMRKYLENMLNSEKSKLNYLIGHGRAEKAEETKIRIKDMEEELSKK